MLDTCEVSKALVIAPLRVARDTWPTETEKWDHLEDIDVSVIVGDKKTRIAALNHPAMVYVIKMCIRDSGRTVRDIEIYYRFVGKID